ncbi:hypothetical protein DXA17_18200 [Ruminococcus sp. AM58-7XD]|nr:hypothetical protein DXA17_18200 [Ruminococcus sp. AM58-7XD]
MLLPDSVTRCFIAIDIWQVQNTYVYRDKLHIKKILINLLGNAVKLIFLPLTKYFFDANIGL